MTTTTINQKIQELRDGLEADQALLAKSQAIEIPDNTPVPSPRPLPDWLSFAVVAAIAGGFGLWAGVILF